MEETMPDLKAISEILIKKGKVRGKPVAITLFRDSPPPSYEPINEEPCTIIRHAMDNDKAVYFDANHHDCLVGVYHCVLDPNMALGFVTLLPGRCLRQHPVPVWVVVAAGSADCAAPRTLEEKSR